MKKGSLSGGVIIGLLVSFFIGIVGNAVLAYLIAQQNFGALLKSIAVYYPTPHMPQTWLKQSWTNWQTIASLALIVLAVIVGGILVQAVGRKIRATSAFAFSLFYVALAVLIQLIVSGFRFLSVASSYPSVIGGLSTWPNFALALVLFFVVVFVLSFIGTLFAKKK